MKKYMFEGATIDTIKHEWGFEPILNERNWGQFILTVRNFFEARGLKVTGTVYADGKASLSFSDGFAVTVPPNHILVIFADGSIQVWEERLLLMRVDGATSAPTSEGQVNIDQSTRDPNDGFGFSSALVHLKDGGRVARQGWNGKGMWLVLVHYTTQTPDRPGVNSNEYSVWSNDSKLLDDLKPLPWIGMRTADGGFVPWLASQTDLLAEDWRVVT